MKLKRPQDTINHYIKFHISAVLVNRELQPAERDISSKQDLGGPGQQHWSFLVVWRFEFIFIFINLYFIRHYLLLFISIHPSLSSFLIYISLSPSLSRSRAFSFSTYQSNYLSIYLFLSLSLYIYNRANHIKLEPCIVV